MVFATKISEVLLLTVSVICVYQIPMTVANGISEIGEHSFARLTLGSGNIGDLRFIDDNELLVSQSEQGKGEPYSMSE